MQRVEVSYKDGSKELVAENVVKTFTNDVGMFAELTNGDWLWLGIPNEIYRIRKWYER